VAWVVTARAGLRDERVSAAAPLGLVTGVLGVRALVAYDLFLQLGVALDYALLGAHFETPGGRSLADFTGARLAAFAGVGARLGG
jgi:hypothetical protein